jgi:hypothetical protein
MGASFIQFKNHIWGPFLRDMVIVIPKFKDSGFLFAFRVLKILHGSCHSGFYRFWLFPFWVLQIPAFLIPDFKSFQVSAFPVPFPDYPVYSIIIKAFQVPREFRPMHAFNSSSQCNLVPRVVANDSKAFAILVPRALLTRGATRGSGQIHNRIP